MISSVSVEAERELIDGALFYAREANAELGLALIAEFERSLGVLCNHPHLGKAGPAEVTPTPPFQMHFRGLEDLIAAPA